jgi:hypothetical protein
MKKRGQAATEFLTTYGWLILILAAVIIVIVNLDLFSPKAPNICNSVNPVFCSDVKLAVAGELIDVPEISLVLSSSGTSVKTSPNDLRTKVLEIKIESPIMDICIPIINTVEPSQNTQIKCSSSSWAERIKEGNRFSGYAYISYYLQETESLPAPLEHNVKVYFSGTIEA